MDPAEPQGNRAARQIAAMHLLFDAERDRHQADVVLASVFELLGSGVKRSTDELLRQIEIDWPGVVLPRERFEAALTVAEERGFLIREQPLTGPETWASSDLGSIGVGDSQAWAKSVLARCTEAIRERAREEGISCSHELATHWTELLLEVLHTAVTASVGSGPLNLREVGRRLFPPYDRDAVVAAVERSTDDPTTRSFLAGLALAALDPSSTFGSEVVHYVATGYVLYAVLLGHDMVDARSALGDFAGELLILDTPVLLRLASSSREFRWTIDLVGSIATKAGARVVVTARTRAEFDAMLSLRDTDAARLQRELADGVSRAGLAIVAPDEVLAIWLRDPNGRTWSEFTDNARSLFRTLEAVGVEVDFVPDGYAADEDRTQAFVSSIQSVTAERGKRRAKHPSAHDGHLLDLAAAVRSASEPGRPWPGAFIITTDRSLDDAFLAVMGNGGAPIALTVSQAAGLLAALAQPADAEKLAELIAADVQWRSKFEYATHFGIDQAIELARSFNASDLDALAVEATSSERTLEGLLARADYDGDPMAAARAAVLQRERRRKTASADHGAAAEAESVRQRERAIRAEAEVDAFRRANAEQAAALVSAQAESTSQTQRSQIRTRTAVIAVTYLLAALAAVTAVALNLTEWRGLALPALAMIAALKGLVDWARTPDSPAYILMLTAASWIACGFLGEALLR